MVVEFVDMNARNHIPLQKEEIVLHIVSRCGHLNIVTVLIRGKAGIDLQDKEVL